MCSGAEKSCYGLTEELLSPDLKFTEACLQCLHIIVSRPVTPKELLYTDVTVTPRLMALLSRFHYTQEYICWIVSHCYKEPDHQTVLFSHGVVQNIAQLLTSLFYKQMMKTFRRRALRLKNMMGRIVTGLSESSVKVRLAAIRCLHPLSRSVQQLQNSF
ncbi:Armadillo repeat-containing protein 8 [Plecturocebus cupreus]